MSRDGGGGVRNLVPRKVAANLGAVAVGPIVMAQPGQEKGPKPDGIKVRGSSATFWFYFSSRTTVRN
ncbi:uncharacterized protein METZ01_LOCUS199713 [marine metagenome]|uniref:Uncharacterized protein n=1 Tax=marine metagenome TaxID=408172 RepID=A0A382E8Y2_9ZZZZ